VLFWYTDGIVECEDAAGQPFGEQRFQRAIREHAHLPPDEALNQVGVVREAVLRQRQSRGMTSRSWWVKVS